MEKNSLFYEGVRILTILRLEKLDTSSLTLEKPWLILDLYISLIFTIKVVNAADWERENERRERITSKTWAKEG